MTPISRPELIGFIDNSGRPRSKGCRFAHGAGCKRFFRLQCTSLTRADKVDLPARIHGSKGVSAHLGITVAERHTEKNVSLSPQPLTVLSLDFREQGDSASCSNSCTRLPLPCTHPSYIVYVRSHNGQRTRHSSQEHTQHVM